MDILTTQVVGHVDAFFVPHVFSLIFPPVQTH